MKKFRCARRGEPSDDGEFIGVELETLAEKRKVRSSGELPTFPFVVVFDKDGKLRRLPCALAAPLTSSESVFLDTLREFALGADEEAV